MYNIFGFYKFKRITNLKKKKELLDNYLKQENFRGTIICLLYTSDAADES